MDKKTLEVMATKAFDNIKGARIELFDAVEKSIEAKTNLEADKAAALSSGKFDGKNAEIREAQAREFLKNRYNDLETMEARERSARYNFDLASLDVDTVKTLLRIAELTE